MGIQVRREGTNGGWVVYDVLHGTNSRKQRYISKKSREFERLGFSRAMSKEEAEAHAKTLKAQRDLVVAERRIARIQLRIDTANLIECAYLPERLRAEFELKLKSRRIRKDHWETAKRLIRRWPRHPREWKEFAIEFYEAIAREGFSVDYANRLRNAMNAWGDFFTERTDARWREIPAARGSDRQRIQIAYEGFKGKRRKRPSGRLSFALLKEHKTRFTRAEHDWLFCARAFGLRPEEADALHDPERTHVGKSEDGTPLLFIYQKKLERTVSNRNKRWKKLPILRPEQRLALKLIEAKAALKQPSDFHGLEDSQGRRLTAYCGRKDFWPAMVKIYDEARVARWMGHRDASTARRHYDDPLDDSPFAEQA